MLTLYYRIQDTFVHCNHTYLLVRLISPLRISIVEPFCSPTKWSQHFYCVPIDCWHHLRSIVPTDFASLVQTTLLPLQKSAVQTARRPVGSSKNPRRRLIAYGLTQCYQSAIPWANSFAKLNLSFPKIKTDYFAVRRLDRLCPPCQREHDQQLQQQQQNQHWQKN
jgi:hypothetical protein